MKLRAVWFFSCFKFGTLVALVESGHKEFGRLMSKVLVDLWRALFFLKKLAHKGRCSFVDKNMDVRQQKQKGVYLTIIKLIYSM